MPFWKKTYTHCSDEELMQYIGKRNTQAFEVLYERYSALMFRFFYRMLWQNNEIANDFTQDIFLKVIEKANTFDTSRNFKSWIYSIAANMCKNAYRNKKTIETIDNQSFEYNENIVFNLDMERYETHLAKAIDELSPMHRECFVLRFLEDLSVKEIALIAAIPEGTVKSRLHFATKKIAAELAWCEEIFK